MPAPNLEGAAGITLRIKVGSISRQREQCKKKREGVYRREGTWD